jgi:hypothetical protein
VFALAAMFVGATRAQEPSPASAWLEFEGAWSASGTRQVLEMGPDRKAGIVYLSGSVVLTEPGGLSRGFRSQAIGFEDGYGTTLGQCVWTDERGDQIFFDLKGVPTETGRHIVGTVTGGTGRYAGLIGEYEFDWRYLIAGPDGELQGWGVDLKGRMRRPAPGEAPP